MTQFNWSLVRGFEFFSAREYGAGAGWRKGFFWALVLARVVWPNGNAEAQTKAKSRYVLERKGLQGEEIATLRDTKLKRVLWRGSFEDANVHWSRDHLALAIDRPGWGFLVWREGQAMRHFGVPGGEDYVMGCVWSPNRKRLLVRSGSSGAIDTNVGRLFCLRLERGKKYHFSMVAGLVCEMRWEGNQTVGFRELSEGDKASPWKVRWVP